MYCVEREVIDDVDDGLYYYETEFFNELEPALELALLWGTCATDDDGREFGHE